MLMDGHVDIDRALGNVARVEAVLSLVGMALAPSLVDTYVVPRLHPVTEGHCWGRRKGYGYVDIEGPRVRKPHRPVMARGYGHGVPSGVTTGFWFSMKHGVERASSMHLPKDFEWPMSTEKARVAGTVADSVAEVLAA